MSSSQCYEYMLEGSVSPRVLPQLVDRLQSITDSVFSDGSAIEEHERVYMLKSSGSASVTMYCRRSLTDAAAPWQLRYLGVPEVSMGQSQLGKRTVLMRSCIMSTVDGDCFKLLTELGFQLCNEHVLKGNFFRKGNVGVTVAQVFTIGEDGIIQNAKPVSTSSLVQARLLAPSGSTTAVDHLWSVADMLKPLVILGRAQ